jgi:hypothetical protein
VPGAGTLQSKKATLPRRDLKSAMQMGGACCGIERPNRQTPRAAVLSTLIA